MDAKFTIAHDPHEFHNGQARLTVIGVGGGGGNAVETMVQSSIKNVTFVCANTDRQALDRLSAPNKIQLGVKNNNRGLGAGANPEVGREAAESDEEQLQATRKLRHGIYHRRHGWWYWYRCSTRYCASG